MFRRFFLRCEMSWAVCAGRALRASALANCTVVPRGANLERVGVSGEERERGKQKGNHEVG